MHCESHWCLIPTTYHLFLHMTSFTTNFSFIKRFLLLASSSWFMLPARMTSFSCSFSAKWRKHEFKVHSAYFVCKYFWGTTISHVLLQGSFSFTTFHSSSHVLLKWQILVGILMKRCFDLGTPKSPIFCEIHAHKPLRGIWKSQVRIFSWLQQCCNLCCTTYLLTNYSLAITIACFFF